jgi:hypothetical protein
MSVGALIAVLVLVCVIVALVFKTVAPDWLPLVLIGGCALAILLSAFPIKWGPPAA